MQAFRRILLVGKRPAAPLRLSSGAKPLAGDGRPVEVPVPRRVLRRLCGVWVIGLVVFGYCPAVTYGWLIWLMNEEQWRWTYLMYMTEVPLVGGLCVIFWPWVSYRPIHQALKEWSRSAAIDLDVERCTRIYQRALSLPRRVAGSALLGTLIAYLLGPAVVHRWTSHPLVEILKTLPAIPLVGGMVGAFCYFGTARALQPVVAWCSSRLPDARPARPVPLAKKFLTTASVLVIAALCLSQTAGYTLGQLITEEHLADSALTRLRVAAQDALRLERPEDWVAILRRAVLGVHGYAFMSDAAGRLMTPHPKGYSQLDQERLYQPGRRLAGREGVWVDRVGQHRVVAFVRPSNVSWAAISVSFPADFALPVHKFLRLSWVVVLEVLLGVAWFGWYFTRGITTPLAELTQTAQRIAEHGDLSRRVPVTTDDELGDLARAFNRMIEELQASKAALEGHAERLEESSHELALLNHEMEDLLRVVSHDLRAPLINIQGFSKRLEPVMQETVQTLEWLAARSPERHVRRQVESFTGTIQPRVAESLRFISKGVEKMDALLSSLLTISRVGRKADLVEPHALDEILDDVLATFDYQLKERSIEIIRHPLPNGVPCRLNEINQVFSNLLSNAINYMSPTGARVIEIGGRECGDHVECFVRDTGIGIDPGDQERIFQMFNRLQTIDAPGEGTGLAYVRKALRSHGGRIRVVSAPGKGSTFFFTLPTRWPPADLAPGPVTAWR